MNFKLGQCPVSWGVEVADSTLNPPWQQYLDEAAAAGYQGVELGPVGYLPTSHHELAGALADRGLELCAGYVMEPLSRAEDRERILRITARTAEILAANRAQCLILIDDMHPGRSSVAGRSDAAARLGDGDFARLVETAHEVARLARDDYGIPVAFHPHAGTYVEFRDEIDRFFSAADPTLIGVCIDTGHSAYAGIDPVDLFTGYASRVRYLHLKDVDPTVRQTAFDEGLSFGDAVARGMFCPLGSGMVDYPTLFNEMEASGFQGWLSVEQDRTPGGSFPGPGHSSLEDACASSRYVMDASKRAHARRS